MASTKVRGITIELGADTSGLSKALKGVNGEISTTQKQLRDVERLLKLDPNNTELLEQKQRLLNDAVDNTKTKLQALKKAQEEVGKTLAETGEGQAQYDALTREIVACEAELKKAETASDKFNVSLAKVSNITGDMSKKFGNLADKTRGLSLAAGGALAGLGGLAVKAAKDADDLNTLAKQTGIATDELQKMQYASDLIDVDVDTITGSLRRMKKGLDENSEAFDNLGVATKKNGQFRDVTEIFYDTVSALSQIPNETERDVMAMELFGKSADELAGIIDDGGASLKALGEEAENLGVIIPQEDIDKANEFNDSLDRLKAEGMGTLAKVGSEIAEMILPYIPKIQEGIEKVLKTIREVDPAILKISAGVLVLVAGLSPMFSLLSNLTGVISAVTGATGGLGGAIAGLSTPVLAIVAVIGVLVAAFKHLWDTNEEFRNNITQSWQNIKAIFDNFGEGIVQRLNALGFNFKNFGEVVHAVWGELCEFLAPLFENAMKTVEGILDGAFKIILGIFDVFAGLFSGNWEQLWNGVKSIFSGIWEAIKSILKSSINVLSNTINGLIKGINRINVKGHSPNIPLIPMLAEGGVMTSGSAIVGEAGAEMLTVSNGQAIVQPLGGRDGASELTSLLETYLPYLAMKQNILLDGNVLVGQTANAMNEALGSIALRSARR